MSAGRRLLLIGGVQGLALIGLCLYWFWTVSLGTRVLLTVVPVDPRSLFQGDYVALGYEIGELDVTRLLGDDGFVPGEAIHVVLTPDDPAWRPVAVSRRWPRSALVPAEAVVLAGRVDWQGSRCPEDSRPDACSEVIRVVYGIETWYVPEGTGLQVEALRDQRSLRAEVAVNRFGHGAVTTLVDTGAAAPAAPGRNR